MDISMIQASQIKPATDSFSTSEVVSSGSLEDIMAKAASKMSAHVTKTDQDLNQALKGDMSSPEAVLTLQKVESEKFAMLNLTASIVGKIPKALEILNK